MDLINDYKKRKELLDLVTKSEDVSRYISCLKEQQELTRRFLLSMLHSANKIGDVDTVKQIQQALDLDADNK
jgi:hypothetical protein